MLALITLVTLTSLAGGTIIGYMWALAATPKILARLEPRQLAALTEQVNRHRRALTRAGR